MKKTVQVLMLSTAKHEVGQVFSLFDKLGIVKQPVLQEDYKPQHLYFTSNEEIKENDYYINTAHTYTNGIGRLYQFQSAISQATQASWLQKVIATTDKSLNLPLIPQYFVEAYVENNGKIEEVSVTIVDNEAIIDTSGSYTEDENEIPNSDEVLEKIPVTEEEKQGLATMLKAMGALLDTPTHLVSIMENLEMITKSALLDAQYITALVFNLVQDGTLNKEQQDEQSHIIDKLVEASSVLYDAASYLKHRKSMADKQCKDLSIIKEKLGE